MNITKRPQWVSLLKLPRFGAQKEEKQDKDLSLDEILTLFNDGNRAVQDIHTFLRRFSDFPNFGTLKDLLQKSVRNNLIDRKRNLGNDLSILGDLSSECGLLHAQFGSQETGKLHKKFNTCWLKLSKATLSSLTARGIATESNEWSVFERSAHPETFDQ